MARDVLLIGTRQPWSQQTVSLSLGNLKSMFVNSAILALTCSCNLHLNVRCFPAWKLHLFKLKRSLRRHTSKGLNKRLVLLLSILSAVFRCGSVPSLASSKKVQVLSEADFRNLKTAAPRIQPKQASGKYPGNAFAGDWQESRCFKVARQD